MNEGFLVPGLLRAWAEISCVVSRATLAEWLVLKGHSLGSALGWGLWWNNWGRRGTVEGIFQVGASLGHANVVTRGGWA